jgi:acetoin utilization deacetylase AcuC-like enzyme
MDAHGFDLAFPPETLMDLEPALADLGFTIEKVQSMDRITYSPRTELTALKRDAETLYLAHLSRELADIKQPTDADLRTVAYLEHCLPLRRGTWNRCLLRSTACLTYGESIKSMCDSFLGD